MNDTKQYVIRTQSNRAYTYGLGEVVSDGVVIFKKDFYDLTKEELNEKLESLGKVTL